MSIASLSNSLTGTLANQTSSTNKKTTSSGTTAASPNIGQQLLAAVAQAQGSTANPLVSLGQSDNAPLTYDAKGLLRQLQNNTLNNPMWQDNSDDSNNGNSQAQSLFAAMHLPTATTGTGTGSSGSTSAADAKAQALAVINGSADSNGNNTNWAQMLKQNPALAGVMLDQQTSQSMISMLA
jgi:hypothetical protein